MALETIYYVYVMAALALIIFVYALTRVFRVRVWIKTSLKVGGPMAEIAYLEMDGTGAAAEVKLSGSGTKPPIGRVVVKTDSAKSNGYVEIVTTDINDESQKAHYKQCGFISFDNDAKLDEFGRIYRQVKGSSKKELIGYTARPSAPNTPTIYGERSWRTLWLVCTLNAYYGVPNPELDKPENKKKDKASKKKGKKGQQTPEEAAPQETEQKAAAIRGNYEFIVINADADDEETMPVAPAPEETEAVAPAPEVAPEETEAVEPAPEETMPVAPAPEVAPEETEAVEPEPTPAPEDKDPKPVPDLSKAGKAKVPAAICHFTGFHRSKNDLLPAEARACAYALLYQKHKKKNYSEFYRDQPYGWRDTALLTTFIFSAIFVVLYLVNTAILGFPLLGNDLRAVVVLIACYYLLWVIVRFVKIDCIENSNSFQPKLDLFNKNLGLKGTNICAVIMGLLAGYFTLEYYDFIPLIWAIVSGIIVNMTLRGANTRWIISSTYNENDDDDDEEETEVKNPDGDIERTYEWELGGRHGAQKVKGNLTLYFNANDMDDVRHCNPFFAQRKEKSDKEYILYMFHFLKEHKSFLARCKYIVYVLDQYTERYGLTPIDRLQFTLDFVQEPNIMFRENKDSKVINFYDDYIKYPDETLYDKEGDCNSKSLLAAMLFHIMGYNVLYMSSRKQKHAAIGIEIKDKDINEGWYGEILAHKNGIVTFNGRKYIFCETTGDEFILGDTIKNMSLDDFEEKILLPAFDEEDEEEAETEDSPTLVSRIYNWELDSELGNKLQGNLTLEFDEEEIAALRQLNPFQTYGHSPNTYADNVRSIFGYLATDESRIAKVQAVADYIRKAITDAGYPELDLAQFALDFAQKPNIEYCFDENSQGIDFAKEYMRFPDEVLFDKEGDCDCKSSLTAALFSALGFRVVFMLSQKLGHAAIGIEASEEMLLHLKNDNLDTVLREYNGRRYLYCETTGDGYRIGHIKEGDSIHDFEELVEIHV